MTYINQAVNTLKVAGAAAVVTSEFASQAVQFAKNAPYVGALIVRTVPTGSFFYNVNTVATGYVAAIDLVAQGVAKATEYVLSFELAETVADKLNSFAAYKLDLGTEEEPKEYSIGQHAVTAMKYATATLVVVAVAPAVLGGGFGALNLSAVSNNVANNFVPYAAATAVTKALLAGVPLVYNSVSNLLPKSEENKNTAAV